MLADIEDVDFVARSIKDLNELADSMAGRTMAAARCPAGERREMLLGALRTAEHALRSTAADLEDILPHRRDTDDEPTNGLRLQDIASHGVLYR